MTEKNEHSKEIENNLNESIEETTTEKTQQQPQKSNSWFKNISKQTIVVAVLCFTLGGITTASITGGKHHNHNKGRQEDMAFRRESKNQDKKSNHSSENTFDRSEDDLDGKKHPSKGNKHSDENDSIRASKREEKHEHKNFSDEKSEKETENIDS